MVTATKGSSERAYVITGPTSGIGWHTALELAGHGTVILVGRDPSKLNEVKQEIERRGGRALSVSCDLSDLARVRRAATEIVALGLPLAGLINNAGIREARPTRSAQDWDRSFATNHVGPFVLTEALLPHMADGTNVVFIVSAVEDPTRKPAALAGFRGGRYISAEASARGEWLPGGSTVPGFDAYATTKQAGLATALAFARETPRLHINAVEPGINPATNLGRDASGLLHFTLKHAATLLARFVKHWSTPERAAKVIVHAILNPSRVTGVYLDERGEPMLGSSLVRDPVFQDRVVAETRALLAAIPS